MAALNSGINSTIKKTKEGIYSRTKNFLGETKGKIDNMISPKMNMHTIQLLLVFAVFVLVGSLGMSFLNPLQVPTSITSYVNVICILLVALFMAMIYLSMNPKATGGTFDGSKVRMYLGRFLGLFMSGFGFTILAMLPLLIAFSGSKAVSGSLLLLGSLILIITSAIIIYIFFHAFLAKQTDLSYAGLLKNTILYIPCLLIDLVEYIRKQYRITTKPILFLLAFDIIFIIIYFNLSRIEKAFKLSNDTTLLKDPIYLNKKRIIGNYEDLKDANKSAEKNEDKSYIMEIEDAASDKNKTSKNNNSNN
jgi:hypothetical protein